MKKIFLEEPHSRKQLLVGAALILVSSAIGGAVLANETSQTQLFVAKSDLPTGAVISQTNFVAISVSGNSSIQGLAELPKAKALKSPIRKGEILQEFDMVSIDDENQELALSLLSASLPNGLANGLPVDLWRVDGESEPRMIGTVEIVAVVKGDYADQSSISILAPKQMVSAIFEAADNIKMVIP